MLRTSIDEMKDNGFKLTKERGRRYPAQTITNADNADDIVLLANTLTQAESLLHSLGRAAADIGLHVNVDKTEYVCFNQRGDISTLNGSFLKLVNRFTNLRSSVSSTEKDINTRLAKLWTAINRLPVILKSDLTDKIKRSLWRKTWRQLHKNAASYIEQVLEGATHKTAAVRPPATHHENYPS